MHRNFYGLTFKKFIGNATVPICECSVSSLVVANTALAALPSLDVRILTLAVAALAFAFEMVTRRTMKLVPTTDITEAALLTAFSGTGTAWAIAKLPNLSGRRELTWFAFMSTP